VTHAIDARRLGDGDRGYATGALSGAMHGVGDA
jgi:hypothetical protein